MYCMQCIFIQEYTGGRSGRFIDIRFGSLLVIPFSPGYSILTVANHPQILADRCNVRSIAWLVSPTAGHQRPNLVSKVQAEGMTVRSDASDNIIHHNNVMAVVEKW